MTKRRPLQLLAFTDLDAYVKPCQFVGGHPFQGFLRRKPTGSQPFVFVVSCCLGGVHPTNPRMQVATSEVGQVGSARRQAALCLTEVI